MRAVANKLAERAMKESPERQLDLLIAGIAHEVLTNGEAPIPLINESCKIASIDPLSVRNQMSKIFTAIPVYDRDGDDTMVL